VQRKLTKNNMKKSQKQMIAAGAGIAAIAAAAAGVYFLTGKNAKNRKKVAKWAEDMKNDVVKELGKGTKYTKATYSKVVDGVAKNYKALKDVSADELTGLAAELKEHWDTISAEVGKAAQTVKKVVPKSAKSVGKKV
jgi:uncharacterized protein YpuA (DUF1002 family)